MRTLAVLLLATAAYADRVDDLLAKAASDSWAERWAAVQAFVRMPVGNHYFKLRAALLRGGMPEADILMAAETGDAEMPQGAVGWPNERRVDVRIAPRRSH